jgi:hypothetical protein
MKGEFNKLVYKLASNPDWKGVADELLVENERLEQQNADLAEENLAAHLVNKELADEVRELKKLSEERRVALAIYGKPYTMYGTNAMDYFCDYCGDWNGIHKPNCDWVRLTKG